MTVDTTAQAQPRLRVFAGPNGSGKSTIQELLRPEWLGAYVNADDIERQIREFGVLELKSFGLSAPPNSLERGFRMHLTESVLLLKHGLQEAATAVSVDPEAVLQFPSARINSYIAAVLADAIRRALLAQGSSFTFVVFDNSGEAHQLIVEICDGEELTIHAPLLPAWFTQTSLWQSFQPGAAPGGGLD